MENTALEKELFGLEKKYWQAYRDNDVATMLALSDDPCLIAGAQGIGSLDKKTLGEMMKNPNSKLNSFEFDHDFKVRMLNDDAAVIAYKVHENLTVDGKPISLDAAESSTWVRRDGQWVCALHTESLSGDPFGRDREKSQAV